MFDLQGRVVSKAAFEPLMKQQEKIYGPVSKFLPPFATTYSPEPTLRAG
jgi:hypothetical protein